MMGSAGKTDEATMSEWERRIGDYGTLRLRLRTAEMLGLPARVCGVRNCRRTRSCLLVFTHNRLPLCYTMLTEDERKAHDEFFDFAASVYEAAQSGHFGNLYRLLIDKPPEYHQAVTEIVPTLCRPAIAPMAASTRTTGSGPAKRPPRGAGKHVSGDDRRSGTAARARVGRSRTGLQGILFGSAAR